jgi:hypothetical protein
MDCSPYDSTDPMQTTIKTNDSRHINEERITEESLDQQATLQG